MVVFCFHVEHLITARLLAPLGKQTFVLLPDNFAIKIKILIFYAHKLRMLCAASSAALRN